jgi:hypothetical protein
MEDSQPPINEAEDYVVRFPCGCSVTFLGSCLHRSSRMTACHDHDGRDQTEDRDEIVRQARWLRWAKSNGPPR